MRFVVMAWDGDYPEAKERRAAVRPVHLENIQPFVDDGHVLVGGAMLDDEAVSYTHLTLPTILLV